MSDDLTFRWPFTVILAGAIFTSGYLRRQARKSGEVIPRAREGSKSVLLRLIFAAPLYLSMFAYVLNPAWMAWASIHLPHWLRWVGAAVGLAMLPLLYWVLRTLGRNVSETVLTKESHVLVTTGPYYWVRHPLYAVATTAFLALGIVAANAFILGMAMLALLGIAVWVIPREEANLVQKFGDSYRMYQRQAGMLIPIRRRGD